MKQKFEPLTWAVKYFNCNHQAIEDYDVLKYRELLIKKLKKKCKDEYEFADALRQNLKWAYWSKCEWELIIELTEDGRVLLKPWVGCQDVTQATIDVTDDETFNWRNFAEIHINKQIYKNTAKIDVWNQIFYQWRAFVTYCWEYRHKWQRRKKDD